MAYTRMIRVYYRKEIPLPADPKAVYRLVRATSKAQREAVDSVLAEFFELELDGYHQKRCDGELANANSGADKSRENGKKGGRPRKDKTNQEPENNLTGFEDENQLGFKNNLSQTPDSRLQTPEEESGGSGPLTAANISFSLIAWERARGKQLRGIMPGSAQVLDLESDRVTPTELRQAYDNAVADRTATGDISPINAGFIRALLAKVRNPPKPRPRADDWDRSKEGIERKGREMGILGRGAESHDSLKARIHEAILARNRAQGAAA